MSLETVKCVKDGVRPVILVPGILGTWLPALAPKGRIDPLIKIYDNLIDGLVKIGYVPGVSLFGFPHDWRLGIEELGGQLANLIDNIRQIGQAGKLNTVGDICLAGKKSGFFGLGTKPYTGPKVDYSKVDIVAHSMGGLLVRAYIQSARFDESIARYITLSTPHGGSVAAYYAIEGGDSGKIGIPPQAAIGMVSIMQVREAGIFQSFPMLWGLLLKKQQIDLQQVFSQTMPSIHALLPTEAEPYLYTIRDGQEIPMPFGFPPNESMNTLNKPERLLPFDKLDEVWSLFSSTYQTRNRIQLKDTLPGSGNLWQHGEPLNDQPAQNYEPGDTLVTIHRGVLPLTDSRSDGLPWKVKHYVVDLSKEINTGLNHVEICYHPAAVRYVLGCLLGENGKPSLLDATLWDKPPIDANKISYAALLF